MYKIQIENPPKLFNFFQVIFVWVHSGCCLVIDIEWSVCVYWYEYWYWYFNFFLFGYLPVLVNLNRQKKTGQHIFLIFKIEHSYKEQEKENYCQLFKIRWNLTLLWNLGLPWKLDAAVLIDDPAKIKRNFVC